MPHSWRRTSKSWKTPRNGSFRAGVRWARSHVLGFESLEDRTLLTVSPFLPPMQFEGVSLFALTHQSVQAPVARFQSTDISGYQSSISWGDGTVTPAYFMEVEPGTYDVFGATTFNSHGIYDVRVELSAPDAFTLVVNSQAIVADDGHLEVVSVPNTDALFQLNLTGSQLLQRRTLIVASSATEVGGGFSDFQIQAIADSDVLVEDLPGSLDRLHTRLVFTNLSFWDGQSRPDNSTPGYPGFPPSGPGSIPPLPPPSPTPGPVPIPPSPTVPPTSNGTSAPPAVSPTLFIPWVDQRGAGLTIPTAPQVGSSLPLAGPGNQTPVISTTRPAAPQSPLYGGAPARLDVDAYFLAREGNRLPPPEVLAIAPVAHESVVTVTTPSPDPTTEFTAILDRALAIPDPESGAGATILTWTADMNEGTPRALVTAPAPLVTETSHDPGMVFSIVVAMLLVQSLLYGIWPETPRGSTLPPPR